MKDIKSMTAIEIAEDFEKLKLPSFRAKQVVQWLTKGAENFDDMTNLPADFRRFLQKNYYISVAIIAKKQVSKYDNTSKYLLRLSDGQYIECVLMFYHHGITLCISTQVGCKMGCTFCATGKSGFSRNLLPSEMLAQIQAVEKDTGAPITNLVLMGMGEPLDNYENVVKFLRLVSSPSGRNLGMRHITLSTCGVVPKIYELAEEKFALNLSVSLHAPNDDIRSKTMPINKTWGVKDLIMACRYYYGKTGRRISFEYAMISGVNDSDECALELSALLKGIMSHINLIPVNDVTNTGYKKSIRLAKFQAILEKNGVTATIRRTLGSDIDAACGQLRRRHEGEVI